MTSGSASWEEIRRERGIPPTRVIDDPELVAPMEAYLTPFRWVLDRLLSAFSHDLYVFGGPPRDVMRYRIEGVPFRSPSDVDIFIDDSGGRLNLNQLLELVLEADIGDPKVFGFGGVRYLQVERRGLVYELFPFSGKFVYLDHPDLPVSVDATLGAIDLNTSSSCYDLRRKRILSCGAFEGIENRQVEINYTHPRGDLDTLLRIVAHAGRFGYGLGPRARAFIQARFKPEERDELAEVISRKHPELELEPLLTELERIAAHA